MLLNAAVYIAKTERVTHPATGPSVIWSIWSGTSIDDHPPSGAVATRATSPRTGASVLVEMYPCQMKMRGSARDGKRRNRYTQAI